MEDDAHASAAAGTQDLVALAERGAYKLEVGVRALLGNCPPLGPSGVCSAPSSASTASGQAALATLSGSEADEFVACVRSEDIARLTRLPGIGTKTAQRLVVEMRDGLAE